MSDLTVLFDLDGTLTDSRAGITACIRHALGKLGRACPDDDALATYIGPPLRGTLSTLLEHQWTRRSSRKPWRTTAPATTTWGSSRTGCTTASPRCWTRPRGSRAAMFVATAKPLHAAVRIVGHFDLARHFAGVYGAEPGGRFDAKTDLLAHLIESGVIRAETAVMVGDRASDILAAKVNGIRSIGALWGYGDSGELAAAGADLRCKSPRAFAACLGRLAG